MPQRAWTGDEISLLRQRHDKESMKSIATKLGRSRSSVQHKARAIGLAILEEDRRRLAKRPRRWTREKITQTIQRSTSLITGTVIWGLLVRRRMYRKAGSTRLRHEVLLVDNIVPETNDVP
jgi:biotin operon repressor